MGKRAEIDYLSNFRVEKLGKYIYQYCPFSGDKCTIYCPQFRIEAIETDLSHEVSEMKKYKITICQNVEYIVDKLDDKWSRHITDE